MPPACWITSVVTGRPDGALRRQVDVTPRGRLVDPTPAAPPDLFGGRLGAFTRSTEPVHTGSSCSTDTTPSYPAPTSAPTNAGQSTSPDPGSR